MSLWSRAIAVAVVGLVLGPTLTAHADSLAETQYWAAELAAVTTFSDATNATCGTHITFDWINKADLKAKTAQPDRMGNAGTARVVCTDIFASLGRTCQISADAKSRVAQKVKSVGCGFANPRTMALSGGKLTLMNNTTEYNFDQWAQPQLANLL
jgi:hypothetical protein